jgi:Domain of unknown function (DUF4157)
MAMSEWMTTPRLHSTGQRAPGQRAVAENAAQRHAAASRNLPRLPDRRSTALSTQLMDQRTAGGMPRSLARGIETMSGVNMEHVRVHYNSPKPLQVQAHAYAQGGDIHLASGQERHLPHEAWHVVQQAQGRVRPTTSVNGTRVNDNPALEREADIMGQKALRV